MRIIAKNHDYYDSVLAFGHDMHVVFERKEETYVAAPKVPLPEGFDFMKPKLGTRRELYGECDNNSKGYTFQYYPFTVAFCGKLYPGIRLDSRKHSDNWVGGWSSEYAYTFESYRERLHHYHLPFHDPSGKNHQRYGWFYGNKQGSTRNEKDCRNYFERMGEDHTAFFAQRRCPIAVYTAEVDNGQPQLEFNSELRRVAFFKVFDPYTTFQELDMFIGGVMTDNSAGALTKSKPKRPNPVDISDTDMRDKKGFDDKSFKTPPTKSR